MTHELKTWPPYFNDVFRGHKTFELRKNDRDYKIGDKLILKEYNPESKQYSGGEIARTVTHVLQGGEFGLEKGYVILSIQ